MKPETVLNLKPGGNPKKLRDEWLREYKTYADEFTNTEELAARLSERVKQACALILERSQPDISTSHDETFYEAEDRRMSAENAALDGDFPLGNEGDAAFAGTYFSIADLVSIQLGYHNNINCGYYTEYNDAVLARNGFVAERKGKWLEAARCYEGVSGSKTVQGREYMCRRKAKAEGERLYAEAQGYIESSEWSEVYWPLQCAVDMGNTDAMTDLGLARIYGQFGCAKDTEEALRLLRTAASSGNFRAAFEICDLYDSGIRIDAHEAMEMCQKAADAGNERAKIRLADGFDLRPYKEILKEQIDKGNTGALWLMEQQCEQENDLEEAAEWFNKAIEAGQVDALLAAAENYANKDSEAYSEELADRYYRRAAYAGSVKAILALGDRELRDTNTSFWDTAMLLHQTEEKVKKPKKAIIEQHKKQFAWYELAAQSGDLSAIQTVCNSYTLGYPVERDYEKSFLWASRGADDNDGVCIYMAAYLYENGFGVEKDVDAAILLYTQASDLGVRSAMLRLYQIYSTGFEHIPVDPTKAAHYLFLSGEGRD